MATSLILEGTAATAAGESFISMDATTNVTPSFNSRITKHPVERQASMADHIVNENVTLTMSGYISNAPLQGQVNKSSLVDSTTNLDPEAPTYDAQRGKRAYNALLKLRTDRIPFTVVTEMASYENCFFTSLTLPRDVSNSEGLQVEATIEQLRIVDTATTDVILSSVAADKQGDSTPTSTSAEPKTEFFPAANVYKYWPPVVLYNLATGDEDSLVNFE